MTRRHQGRETLKSAASLGALLIMARLALAPSKGRAGDWLRTKVASAIETTTDKLRVEKLEHYAQRGQAQEFELVCGFFRDVAGSMRDRTRSGANNDQGATLGHPPVDQHQARYTDPATHRGVARHLHPATPWESPHAQYPDQSVQTPSAYPPQHVVAVGRVSMPRPTLI